MLLKTVKVTNNQGDILELPLETPESGFIVKSIDGLGPVKATLVSSSFANMDGQQYHSSKREARNLVFKLGLDPDYSQMNVYDLRANLYRYLMPKSEAKFEFGLFDRHDPNIITQNLDVEIMGRVESMEPDMFAKDPTLDLSAMCYDSDFVDPNLITFEGTSVQDLTEVDVEYTGDIETGVLFRLLPDVTVSEFSIYNRTPSDALDTLNFTEPLNASDILEINSVPGEKYVRKTSGGVESSLVYGLTAQSAWLTLYPGTNHLRVYTPGVNVPFEIEYTRKFGGL